MSVFHSYQRDTLLANARSYVVKCGDEAFAAYMDKVSKTSVMNRYRCEQWVLIKLMCLYVNSEMDQ